MLRAPSHLPQVAIRGRAPPCVARRGRVTFCSEAAQRVGQAGRSGVGVLGCLGCRPCVLLSSRHPFIIILYTPSCLAWTSSLNAAYALGAVVYNIPWGQQVLIKARIPESPGPYSSLTYPHSMAVVLVSFVSPMV